MLTKGPLPIVKIRGEQDATMTLDKNQHLTRWAMPIILTRGVKKIDNQTNLRHVYLAAKAHKLRWF